MSGSIGLAERLARRKLQGPLEVQASLRQAALWRHLEPNKLGFILDLVQSNYNKAQ